MSRRTDLPFRPPGDELEGAAGCVAFAMFLVVELAVAGAAALVAYGLARSEPIDPGHAIGMILSLIVGIAALLWIDHHCRRVTGHSAGEMVFEFVDLW